MAEGVSLSEMLDMLRAEARISMNVAHGQSMRDAQVHMLRRVQEELALAHDWPTLKVSRTVTLQPGVARYEFPDDMDYGWVNAAYVQVGLRWVQLAQGIEPEHRSLYPADFRSWPIQRWAFYPDQTRQFEVWPLPSQSQSLEFRGRKRIAKLVDNNDKSTLDANAIVLFAAAELLAANKAEDAQLKLQKAQNYLRALKARYSTSKHSTFVMGGGRIGASDKRPGLDFIPTGYGKGP